jgi:hypothetical protein
MRVAQKRARVKRTKAKENLIETKRKRRRESVGLTKTKGFIPLLLLFRLSLSFSYDVS